MCTVWRCAKSVAKTADLGKRNLLKSSIAMNLLRERSSRSNIRQHSYFFYFCIAKSSAKCERKQRRRCKMNAPKGCSRSPFARSIHLSTPLFILLIHCKVAPSRKLQQTLCWSHRVLSWRSPKNARLLYTARTWLGAAGFDWEQVRSGVICTTLYHIFW